MTKHFRCQSAVCVAFAATLLVTALSAGYPVSIASAEVSGTTFVSSNYGYTITWQLPWYVTEDDTDDDGFDVLGLADSQSFVYFSGNETGGDPARVIANYADEIANGAGNSGFAPVDDPQCAASGNGESIVARCYRFDVMNDDGSLRGLGVMLKAWDLGNGIDLLLEAYTEEALLASFVPHWNEFGVFAPGEPAPTPAANSCQTETLHDVAYCMDPALSDRDRSDISEGVRLGQDTIAAYFGDPDLGDVQITGLQGVSPFGDGLLATTRDRSIAVYAGSEVWNGVAPVERVETLVHEYFHIYQNVMTEEGDTAIPLWFSEGTAEAVGFLAAEQIGVTDQAEFYDAMAYSLTVSPFPGTLADLETASTMGADAYPLAYIAVQYLLGSRGMSVAALGDAYEAMHDGATFDEAFTQVFGLTPDAFVIEFEAWRPSFQRVDALPDDFYPIFGDIVTGPVTLPAILPVAERDQQWTLTGTTTPLASCSAALQIANMSIDRETVANGEGGVFWLFSVPPNAPTGVAQVTVDCGGGPASAVVQIS